MLGILGGSGAGKTTLLNAISGRILSSKRSLTSRSRCSNKSNAKKINVSGTVAYKGFKRKLGSSDVIKYVSAYVMQHNAMCPTATCNEALLFSSKLRSGKSAKEQLGIINTVITSLQLNDCRDTRIGNGTIDGMSGGERKRTAVGIELVIEPDLIFLDACIQNMFHSFACLSNRK